MCEMCTEIFPFFLDKQCPTACLAPPPPFGEAGAMPGGATIASGGTTDAVAAGRGGHCQLKKTSAIFPVEYSTKCSMYVHGKERTV